MAFKRPTLVFVPGAWHSPSAFARTTKLLEGEGYKCIGVTLPSVRPGPPFEPNFDRDIASIRAAMTKEAEAGNDILLIMHSYAGIPGGAACEGLLKKPGEDGGVVGLVYISSLCGPIGFSVTRSDKLEENYGLSPWCKVDGEALCPITPHETFYNDLSLAEAQPHIDALQLQSLGAFQSKQTFEPWRHVPATFLLCERDNAIPAAVQEMLFAPLQEGAKEFVLERLDSGHSPFLSRPGETAGIIRRAARERVLN